MRPYFEYEVELLADTLQSWLGTPWRHHCQVKRLGSDCIGMVYGVLVETGAILPRMLPAYPRDWHMHNDDELLVHGLRETPGMMEISDGSIMDGDVLVYRYGRASAHTGIYHDRGVYHIPMGQRCMRSPFGEHNLESRLRFRFRCMVEGNA